MVGTDLSDELIAEGAKLIEHLDESGVEVPAALWVRFPDAPAWKLALSLPAVAEDGPKQAYRLVQKALTDLRNGVTHLGLDDVAVLKADAPLLDLLRVALRTGPGVSQVWFTGNVINGQLFPDSLVYRVS